MGKPNSAQTHATSRPELKVVFEPYYLSSEEDDERIRRLAKKILACVHASKRRKNSGGNKESEDVSQILGEREIL
jgi:hypothetical protein